MSQFMTYDYWKDNFRPITNTISKHGYYAFETYGEEQEFVQAQPNEKVWTEVDGDSGTYIISGFYWVNRIQYYVTEEPWTDDYTEIPTWCYRMCDCTEETGDYDENCTEDGCDEGTIDIPCDTVVDLKNIYGEDAPIVS